jgi:hypothetical protein
MTIRSAIPPVLMLLAIGSGIMCQPKKVSLTLFGKLAIDTSCGHFVIEVLQGSIDGSKIVPEWKNPADGSIYINCFAVANFCDFPSNSFSKGDIFSFELDPHPAIQHCPICFFDYPAPPVSNAVKDLHKVN